MVKFTLVVSVLAVVTTGSYARPSELFGSGVSQTGSKWPPYPWAGLDYWAVQAGFYGPGASTATDGADKAVESTRQSPRKKGQQSPRKSGQQSSRKSDQQSTREGCPKSQCAKVPSNILHGASLGHSSLRTIVPHKMT